MARISPTIFLGKTIRRLARLRSGGSALPGLVVEKLQPSFLTDSLGQLPHGVVLVTGTNGKTTTTKMIAELLTQNGLRVLTNRTGSNFTRGIIATIIEQMDLSGELPFDIAVLELDEAYARHFVRQVRPNYVVALNVMRDQLDRFGEIDATARMLLPVLAAASEGCIINRDDPLLARQASRLKTVRYFGVDQSLRTLFPTDEELHAGRKDTKAAARSAVTLAAIDGQTVTYQFGRRSYTADLALSGSYNFQNAAAALAVTIALLPDASPETLVKQLAEVQPAFGRGETLTIDGHPLELVLVKNPAGFRLSLASFVRPGRHYMIAINDAYADGRDMSWLWDVEFGNLARSGVEMASGVRAYDMALRLQYDEVPIARVEPRLDVALRQFLSAHHSGPRVIFCTYTAMLDLRRMLKKYTSVERAL